MGALWGVGGALLGLVGWRGQGLYRQYKVAQRIGLPIVVCPVNPNGRLWVALYSILPSLLPLASRFADWPRYSYLWWQYNEGGTVLRRHGPAFTLCTPRFVEVYVADAKAGRTILSKRRSYLKPLDDATRAVLEIYGSNVDSSEGEEWQRHRRLTAPSLTEGIHEIVWKETTAQARSMLQAWTACGSSGTRSIRDDNSTVALNVISKAGFGIQCPYRQSIQIAGPAPNMTYRESLSTIVRDFFLYAIFPKSWYSSPLMPERFQRLNYAYEELLRNMMRLVKLEKDYIAKNEPAEDSFVSKLVRTSEEARNSGIKTKLGHGLGEREIHGNLYDYSFAAYATTTEVIAAAIAYLAAYPQWQDWVRQELRVLYGNGLELSFEEAPPKLKRCLALMYETLRLNGPVLSIPKTTSSEAQTITLGNKEHTIPPDSLITVNIQAIHCDSQLWGPDTTSWRPDRWIKETANGEQTFLHPGGGTFLPWGEGPRICPGRRFSQLQFMATIATLFRTHAVHAVPEMGMTSENAKAAALKMVKDSVMDPVVLRMRNPKAIALAWEAVESS